MRAEPSGTFLHFGQANKPFISISNDVPRRRWRRRRPRRRRRRACIEIARDGDAAMRNEEVAPRSEVRGPRGHARAAAVDAFAEE